MHSLQTLLVLLAATASAISAQLPARGPQGMAVVRSIVTVAMSPDDSLSRRSDDSCRKAAMALAPKISSALEPFADAQFTSSLSLYMSAHPEIKNPNPTSLVAGMCEASGKGQPTITGPVGSKVTEMASSMESFWSSITPDIQAMWAQCSTVKGAESLMAAIPTACGAIRADVTGRPPNVTVIAGAPKATGVTKAILAVAGVAVAGLYQAY